MRHRILIALGLGLGLFAMSSCDRNSEPDPVVTTTTTDPGGGGGGNTVVFTTPSIKSFSPARDTSYAWQDSIVTFKVISDAVSPNLISVNGIPLTPVSNQNSVVSGTVTLALGENKLPIRVVRAGDSSRHVDTSITLTRLLPLPSYSVKDSISYQPVTVAISAPGNLGTIRFTTNGRDPGSSDSAYVTPLTFNGTTTLKARLFTPAGAYSQVVTQTYQIYHQVQKPTFTTRTVDTFNTVLKVAIRPASSTDTIRYTTDGGDPTTTSPIYRDSILIDLSKKIKAASFNGMNKPSAVESTTVELQALPPVFSLAGGTYRVTKSLTFSTASNCNIYYTVDSTRPVSKWTLATAAAPVIIDTNVKVWAYAGNPGWTPSAIISNAYAFVTSTPTFSLKAGTYDTTQTLVLADSTVNSSVHYTLDGTTPACEGPQYGAPLTLDATTMVKVIGCRSGWTSSSVDSALYTFKIAPIVFTPDSGIFDGSPTIALKTRSPGVSFFYTIDSTTPTSPASGTTVAYSAPFVMGRKGWLRVVGTRPGWTNSDIANRYYFVQGDTLSLGDFENGTTNTAWGVPFSPFGCATGTTLSTGQAGCTVTKNPADLLTRVPAGSPSDLGDYALRMQFDLHPASTVGLADERNGPGFAGVYALVPSSFMGRANTVAFWARFKPEGANTAVTAPLMVEFSHSGLDNGAPGLSDGFERAIIQIDTTWRFYQLAFGNFWYPYFAIQSMAPKTSDDPPGPSWIDIAPENAGNAGSMTSIGLNRWWGSTIHSNSTINKWLHGVNRDQTYSKGTISKFRWSILQPSGNAASLTGDEDVTGLSNTFKGSLYLDRVQVYRPKI